MKEPWRTRAALGAILLLALVLRLWGSRFGAPHLYHPDEPKLVTYAMRLMDVAHLSRDGFLKNGIYPPLTPYLYVLGFVAHGVVGALGAFGPAASLAGTLADQGNQFSIYYTARLVSIACAVATVLVSYLLGSRLYGRRVGLVAALLLALCPLHVRDAHYATADVPATLFATLAVLAAARTLEDGSRRAAMVAGLAAALAAAAKYQAGVVALVVVLALVLGRWLRGEGVLSRATLGRVALAGAASLALFLVLVPFPILDAISHFGYGAAWKVGNAWRFQMEVETEGKVGILRGDGPFALLTGRVYPGFGFTRPNDLPRGMGFGLFAASMVSTIVLAARGVVRRRGTDLVLVALPIAIILLIDRMHYQAVRHLLPAVPCLAIAAAAGLVALVDGACRRLGRPSVAALATIIVAVALAGEGGARAARANQELAREDSRTIALGWLERRYPRGAKVALEFYGPPLVKARTPSRGADGRPRFALHDTAILRYFGGDDRREPSDPKRAIQRFAPDAIVLDGWSGHRFYLDEARRHHPRLSAQRRELYRWIESSYRLATTIRGEDSGRQGPTIRIFTARSASPSGAAPPRPGRSSTTGRAGRSGESS
ncbi:MAG: glycosyltransferase family 39 protein [Deltaproteobacteria bacterium]|nr:glycosyltransferase family 39 protein [Deltaproteobacteria bacterium]